MGIKININNTKIGDKARVISDASINTNDDVVVNIQDSEINGQASVLENLEIGSVLNELNQKMQSMDKNSDEYLDIQRILSVKQWTKKDFIICVTKHVAKFSQGVLASIVANLIT